MGLDRALPPPPQFQHDIARLNLLAEQAALFATVWLGKMMRGTYLPPHAKDAYISTLAYNYSRRAPLARQTQRLAWRLAQHYAQNGEPFRPDAWVQTHATLNILPSLPTLTAERRFMRYLALRDLQEFIGAFAATPQERAALRPWVRAALVEAMRQNQLEQAWDNSITLWDNQIPPRPRTIIRARLQPGLWQAYGVSKSESLH
ncbi:MAG: hypothetical protein KBA75_05535 [Alphaproteobacteria bacterium]|nr:hypothetical protein [Alphaproteobacteria bacterium]